MEITFANESKIKFQDVKAALITHMTKLHDDVSKVVIPEIHKTADADFIDFIKHMIKAFSETLSIEKFKNSGDQKIRWDLGDGIHTFSINLEKYKDKNIEKAVIYEYTDYIKKLLEKDNIKYTVYNPNDIRVYFSQFTENF